MKEASFLKISALRSRMILMLSFVGIIMIISTEGAMAQIAVASNSGPVCTGNPVMLSETGGNAVAWEWSSSGAAVFDNRALQNPTATGVVDGEVFTVRITDAASSTAMATTIVTVFSAAPVSFAGTAGAHSFAAMMSVFGENLISSGDRYYLICGADVNQDGIVDTGDMNDVDKGSASIMIGYNVPDVNGDGPVDTSDMNMVDNNSAAIVYVRIPFN